MTNTALSASPAAGDWRLLRVYALYRVFLAALLYILFQAKLQSAVLGIYNPQLYSVAALAYLAFTIISLAFTRPEGNAPRTRSFLLIFIDIVALTTLTHASGGISSNLTLLLVVTVAAGNILLSGQIGILVAALATIAVLYEQFFFSFEHALSTQDLTVAAFLGITFFAVGILSQQITRRLRQSEERAAQQEKALASLQRLNEQIIQRMRTGIIVVDEEASLLLSNDAALQLLNTPKPDRDRAPLANMSERLAGALREWEHDPQFRPRPFKNTPQAPEISASFAVLAPDVPDATWATLIFLEDNAHLSQQAQQLKLASLGRFTASIAHEIRNPLGAISHASQLLAESPELTTPDKRLLDIVQQQSRRMNSIIENILQLSRRQQSLPELFDLASWLNQFRSDYLTTSREQITMDVILYENPLPVRFDPEQLFQVVQNLVSNGLRYSEKHSGIARISLLAGRLGLSGLPYLDIIDEGPGIDLNAQQHLFEPFYTTERTGTGLGLYISRELCEANQARLDYLPREEQGACFRVTFAHPDRLILSP